MAEIILPPEEEQEETPQVPELNIDKPTENSKVITIEFEAKKTNKVSTKDTKQQLYTTDTDAWFEFKETSLEGANGTYSVVFRNRHDGSIFQRTGDVVNGIAYYKIPHQEIRHAGAWRGQLVYTLENGNTTAREFDYVVKGHILDGKDVREIVVEDFETLMSQLNSMKDNAELELANLTQELKNTAEQNEADRQAFFDDLVEDINDLQENYQELLDTGVLQTNINEKLEELEEEYAPKLTEVTAQLAHTDNKEKEIRRNKKKIKAQFVFVDDDGHNAILSKLKPIFTEKNIPMTIALYSNSSVLSPQYVYEVLQLQDQHGWEISSHGNTPEGFSTLSETQLHSNLQAVNQILSDRGFNVDTVIYPNGQHNEMVRRVVSNYYKAGAQVSGGVNEYPLNSFNLSRHSIDDGTLEEHKEKVDEAFAKKGLLIFMSHCGQSQWDESRLSMLNDLIDYIKSKNGEITTLSNAIENVGNVVEVGDSISHGSVSISASGQAKMIQQIVPVNGTTVSTPITAFSKDLISVMHFNATNSSGSGFPNNNQGTLLTYRYSLNDYGAFQIWHPYSTKGDKPSYKRIWIGLEDRWSDFISLSGITIKPLNAYDVDYKDYQQGLITMFPVNSAAGFPGSGTVKTFNLGGGAWLYQEFQTFNNWTKSIRYMTTSGEWSAWKKFVFED